MLSLCNSFAQAALGAVVKPLRHYGRHWSHHAVGHGAHHVPIHHAAVTQVAAPQATGPIIACVKMPGSLLAGPLSASAAGPAGSGALARSNGGPASSGYASNIGNAGNSTAFPGVSADAVRGGGGVFGRTGLAAALAPFAAGVLIAMGFITAVIATLYQSFSFEQPAPQPVAMANMTSPVMVSPVANAFSPDFSLPEGPVTLAAGLQPSVTIPNLLEQIPEAPASSGSRGTGTAGNTGSAAVPEPPSVVLLGLWILCAAAARELGRVGQRQLALAPTCHKGSMQ